VNSRVSPILHLDQLIAKTFQEGVLVQLAAIIGLILDIMG
jgi:hypothetical protein